MPSTNMPKISLKVEIEATGKFNTQVSITNEDTGHVVVMPAHRDLLFERVEEFIGNNLRVLLRPFLAEMKRL